jgi:phage shock protein A
VIGLSKGFWKKSSDINVEEIQELLIAEKSNFKDQYEKYEKELKQLEEENTKIKKEIKILEKEMDEYRELKEKIQVTLYNSHRDSCKEVYDTGKKFDDMVQYKTRIIKIQQSKNIEIKSSINTLLIKIKSILSE